jgi:chaperonin GroEL
MKDNIFVGGDAVAGLYKGAKKLADAVSVTMGPKGKLVIIDNGESIPHLTKDGVTVANAIKLRDPIENAGAAILRESSRRTAYEAGDGTTTTAVLGSSLIEKGLSQMSWHGKDDCREFLDGLDDALKFSLNELEKIKIDLATPTQIKHVATISANSDELLGNLLSEAINKLGPSATIIIEESKSLETTIDFVEGTEIDRGFISPHFANVGQNKCKFENPLVAVFMRKLNSIREIMPMLEYASKRPLVIFAEDFDNEILKALIINNQKDVLRVCCVKLPEFNQGMHESAADLSAIFGGKTIDESCFYNEDPSRNGILKFETNFLGSCKSVEIGRNKTTVLKPNHDKERLNGRIENVQNELKENCQQDRESLLKRRLQRMANGICLLKVGASSEVELKEKLDRVDDAVNATRVAALYGILPGSGISLKILSDKLMEAAQNISNPIHRLSYETYANSLLLPAKTILSNAGYSKDKIEEILSNVTYQISEVSTESVYNGYDSLTGQYVNLIDAGIIDPYFVTLNCLKNSVSVAKKILEVGCYINTNYESFENEEI